MHQSPPWPGPQSVSALRANDEQLEVEAVLAGHVVSLLTSVTAAHIRARRLVPLLAVHVTDHLGMYMYHGGRTAQPVRAETFIDLAIARLGDNTAYCLSEGAGCG